MSENHPHYNVEKQPEAIRRLIEQGALDRPCFIGQGVSYQVGSDRYGKYIVDIKSVGNKVIFGLCNAAAVMHGSWTEGTMDCSMPKNAVVGEWIVQSGWFKHKNGYKSPKFYKCSEDGVKINGAKVNYGFNGARQYQDPSF